MVLTRSLLFSQLYHFTSTEPSSCFLLPPSSFLPSNLPQLLDELPWKRIENARIGSDRSQFSIPCFERGYSKQANRRTGEQDSFCHSGKFHYCKNCFPLGHKMNASSGAVP